MDLDQLHNQERAATAGPWVVTEHGRELKYARIEAPDASESTEAIVAFLDWLDFGADTHRANAEFIAAARTAVPELLEALEQALEERDEAIRQLSRWSSEHRHPI